MSEEKGGGGLWIVGVILTQGASLGSALGIIVMKYSNDFSGSKTYLVWLGGLVLMISGALMDFAAFGFAAQSLIAPLGSETLICNAVMAPCLLGETITRMDMVATVIIAVGCTLSVAFGDHATPTYTVEQLMNMFDVGAVYAYFFITVITVAVAGVINYYIEKAAKENMTVVVPNQLADIRSAPGISPQAANGSRTPSRKDGFTTLDDVGIGPTTPGLQPTEGTHHFQAQEAAHRYGTAQEDSHRSSEEGEEAPFAMRGIPGMDVFPDDDEVEAVGGVVTLPMEEEEVPEVWSSAPLARQPANRPQKGPTPGVVTLTLDEEEVSVTGPPRRSAQQQQAQLGGGVLGGGVLSGSHHGTGAASGATLGVEPRIAAVEIELYGTPTGGPVMKRLESVEEAVFGEKRVGDILERVQTVEEGIGLKDKESEEDAPLTEEEIKMREEQAVVDAMVAAMSDRDKVIHAALYGYMGGIMGGCSVLFGKTVAELMKNVGAAFGSWELYIFLVVMVATLLSQIKFLNIGLKYHDAMVVVPIYQTFWILGGIFGGTVYFREFDRLPGLSIFFFIFGVVITLGGVYLLTYYRINSSKDEDKEADKAGPEHT